MEGRILTEAFAAPLPAPEEPTRLVWPVTEPAVAPDSVGHGQIEQLWNLAMSRVDGGDIPGALSLVEKLQQAQPDNFEFMLGLFEGQLALRKVGEARQTLELLLDQLWETPQAALLQARLEYAARRYDVSLRHLESIKPDGPPVPRVNLQIGFNLLKMNQSARARDFYKRELEIQPESAEAYAGLSYCALRAGKFEQAIEYAFKAITLNYELHYAHFFLGLASARKGDVERALVALKLVAALRPDFAPVHRCLAILYRRDPAQEDLARKHQELAQAAVSRGRGF
jgi:tetratricopeptide (TPR) repeat protein